MIHGLTLAGLGDISSNRRFIELAAEYGFGSVDLNPLSLIEECGGIETAIKLLQDNGVLIGSIGLPVEWRNSEEQFKNDLINLPACAKAAVDLGCNTCCTYILPSTDQKAARFMANAIKRLRTCAEILGTYDIRFGLEFVGPHHLRETWKNPYIWTMGETLEMIDAIGLPNIGLLLDSYHWYTTGLTTTEILHLKREQIVHVHINDAHDIPINEVRDNDRIYPGEGVIDLVGFIESIHKVGYNGVIAQEVISPKAPNESTEQLLIRSKAGFDKVFASII